MENPTPSPSGVAVWQPTQVSEEARDATWLGTSTSRTLSSPMPKPFSEPTFVPMSSASAQ